MRVPGLELEVLAARPGRLGAPSACRPDQSIREPSPASRAEPREEDQEKLAFLESVIIALEGMIHLAKRYADLAREIAAKESDPERKRELETVAEVCEWVPANPPRSFQEALQLYGSSASGRTSKRQTLLDSQAHPEERRNLVVRVPGYSASWVELGSSVRAVNVLPYHRFGLSKYEMLDLEYELGDLKPPSQEDLDAIVTTFESLGLECEIVT
jgi:autonomous glycyl radical cofactor GrcA